MRAAEVRVRAARLAEALAEADPQAIRAALHKLTPVQANRVARAAAPLMQAAPEEDDVLSDEDAAALGELG